MTDITIDIQSQIAQEQSHLQAVEKARKDRINQEQRELKEIETSKQRIAALQRQQAQVSYEEALALNAPALAANNQEIEKLFDVLSGIQQTIAAGYPQYERVEKSFQAQQNVHDRVINAAQGLLTEMPIVDDDRLYDGLMRKQAIELRSYEGPITPALSIGFALMRWVTLGKGEPEIRYRQGIAWAITGMMFPFDEKNPPTDEAIRNQLKSQLSRVQNP